MDKNVKLLFVCALSLLEVGCHKFKEKNSWKPGQSAYAGDMAIYKT